MKHHVNYALIAAAAALAACGGGGAPATQPLEGLAQQVDTETGRAEIVKQARSAANAIPKMGSVTQSSNVDENGRTTDTAQATFDGTLLSLTIAHRDDSTTSVTASSSDLSAVNSEPLVANHRSGRWTEGREINGLHQTLIATISYNPDDATDWLAGGLLITADGSGGSVGAGDVSQIAWIDGPEIGDSDSVDLTSVSGTATYSGEAFGNYTTTTSGGTLTIGTFQSDLQLTVNFGDDTVNGCVGCDGADVRLDPYYRSDGNLEADDDPASVEFRLGQIGITPQGIFNNGDVDIRPDPAIAQYVNNIIQDQSGKWGGRFSTRSESNGRPRAAAVTFGGSFSIVSPENGDRNAVVYQGVSLPTPSGS